MTLSTAPIAQELAAIVGAAHVVPMTELETHLQLRLIQAGVTEPEPVWVVYPGTQSELAAVVASAQRHHWPLLPCGAASKIHWGGCISGVKLIVSTQRLQRLVEHAVGDMTVTAEAGMPLAQLQTTLAPTGQFLALDPAYGDRATIGGILASRDAGSWRQRYGGVRDLCLGLSFVRYDGEIVKAGGRVVKNVAGYDLMKLLTGSFGTLGIVSQITLRLYPLPEASRTLLLVGAAAAIAPVHQNLLNSGLTPTAVDLLSRQMLAALDLSGQVGLLVRFQGLAPSVALQSDRLLATAQTQGLMGKTFQDDEETQLWQHLQQQLWDNSPTTETQVISKIGVLPAQSVALMQAIDQICDDRGIANQTRIYAGSGLGVVRLVGEVEALQTVVLGLRSRCQAAQGWLTVLEAPITLKKTLEVWGYTGNALTVMRQLKAKFDPDALFSPNRFLGGM